jgi:hypothetical protein
MSDWKSIETAPQDGTDLVIADGGGLRAVAYWNRQTRRWDRQDDGAPIKWQPIYWMPLPPPPLAGLDVTEHDD